MFASGEKYSGDFSYDMISGEGEMVYTDDCRYIGQWMNGLVSGKCDSANKARFRHCSLFLVNLAVFFFNIVSVALLLFCKG